MAEASRAHCSADTMAWVTTTLRVRSGCPFGSASSRIARASGILQLGRPLPAEIWLKASSSTITASSTKCRVTGGTPASRAASAGGCLSTSVRRGRHQRQGKDGCGASRPFFGARKPAGAPGAWGCAGTPGDLAADSRVVFVGSGRAIWCVASSVCGSRCSCIAGLSSQSSTRASRGAARTCRHLPDCAAPSEV